MGFLRDLFRKPSQEPYQEETLPMGKEERQIAVQEKILDATKEVTGFVQEMKKTTKVGRYYLYLVILLIVVVYVGLMGYSIIASGGFENWADKTFYKENINRRFDCWNQNFNVTLQSIVEVNQWKQAFNVTCEYKEIG